MACIEERVNFLKSHAYMFFDSIADRRRPMTIYEARKREQ